MSDETPQNQLDPYADNPDVQLRDHTYDGIQEYDQKLPNWWLWSWYIFIILFVVCWVLYYQVQLNVGWFKSDGERVDAAIAKIEAAKASKLEDLMGALDDNVLWEMSKNAKIVAEGEATYKTICVACHAPDLGGRSSGAQYVGEPLNDAEWKYGNRPMQVFEIVMNGSPDKTKGMAPWNTLGGETCAKIVAFILSNHTPPDAAATDS